MSNYFTNKNFTDSLTVILPCFNPQDNWEKIVLQNYHQIQNEFPQIELQFILVNDGSSFSLQREIAFLQKHIPHIVYLQHQTNAGKGKALRTGFEAASSKWLIFTDIDFPFTHQSFSLLFATLVQNEYDIVAGSRQSAYYAKVPFFRKYLSIFFKKQILRFLNINIYDTQCGLKGFSQKGKSFFLQTKINRYLFDLELFVLATQAETLKIKSVQVELKDNIVFTKMGWKILANELFNFIGILWKFKSPFRKIKD